MSFGEYYISNILFNNLDSGSSNGGAISFSISTFFKFKLFLCSFLNCRASSSFGGAIWFNCTNNGQIQFDKICGNLCYSGASPFSYYQFAYIQTSSLTENFLNFLSMTRCYTSKSDNHYPLRIHSKYFDINSLNSTNNICHYVSSIYFFGNNDILNIKYSTFVSNNANYMLLSLNSLNELNISKSNFIKNNSPLGSSIITLSSCLKTFIEECHFYQNVNRLFEQTTSSSYILNCYFDALSTSGVSFQIFNNFMFVTNTFILKHFQTISCHADFPISNQLTSFESKMVLFNFLFLNFYFN